MSHSPLALADIRPRADSSLDDAFGGPTGFDDGSEKVPTNSNYLAPWAVYAFDWCKWPVQGGNGAGKIAIGSYLEDPHNYVGDKPIMRCYLLFRRAWMLTFFFK